MAEAKWSGVLSTTEPRNDVGIIKVRQGNVNSEVAEFQIVQNNKPYNLTGLTVYFCASFGLNLVEKPAIIVNAAGGRIQYTFDDDSMQSLGRQKGYFSIKKEESKIDSTQDFEYQVESSLMTRSIDGKSYIYKLSALIKILDDFVKNGQKNFNTWFDSVKEILYGVDPGGNILRELIEARKNSSGNIFTSLKERLDKNEDETNRQLAHTANKVYSKKNLNTKPLVTFYLDDATSADFDIVYPVVSQLGIPITICAYNDSQLIGRQNDLQELIDNGWEIHGHNINGESLNGMSEDEMRATMKGNKEFLEKKGYEINGYTYPLGYANETALKVAREFFTVAMGSDPGINTAPIDTYYINRYLTDSGTENIRQAVDKIVADGTGWVVIYAHAGQFTSYPERKTNFFEMVDYCVGKGIDIVTVGEAMGMYANTLDIGDVKYGPAYTKIGSDGAIKSNQLPFIGRKTTSDVNGKLGTDFPAGDITVNKFGLSTKSDIPFDSGIGTLYTDRLYEAEGLKGSIATQIFVGHKGRTVTRYYETSLGWSSWVDIGLLNKANNNYNETTPITDYPVGVVTTTGFLLGQAPNLPEGGIGTLMTDRTGNAALNYQIFIPYRSNTIYKRYWNNSSNSWSVFSKHVSVITHSSSFDFGQIPAGGYKDYVFNIIGVSIGDVATVNFVSGIANGVVPIAYITANNTVNIKLINITSAAVSVGTRTAKFLVHVIS